MLEPAALKAVIFDFDGLIADTEWPLYVSWKEAFEAFGGALTIADWAMVVGTTEEGRDLVAGLETQIGRPVDRMAFHKVQGDRHGELSVGLKTLPGVRELIAECKRCEIKLAVASSSEHVWVDHHLKKFGLFDDFPVVRCRDDVGGRAKPNPDVFLAALEGLGVSGAETVVLEDSLNGVRAAKAAGCRVVAVPTRLTGGLDFSEADWVVGSLLEVDLGRLMG